MRALSRSSLAQYGTLWFVLVVAALCSRPPWPIDETRYLAVAWEMWTRSDFLVPFLNGAPYSDKPPLLFWLFHLGWVVFGVNDWWPRLVPALLGLATVALTRRLARLLWPERARTPDLSAWILAGSLLWVVFTTLLMFDLLVACLVVFAMTALVQATRSSHRLWPLVLFGAALGAGILAKGPVMLLYTMAPALAAPWWSPPLRARSAVWYMQLALALGLGVAIALAWALPAAAAGGAAYGSAIFWGQTAGRITASFAHRAPWWWYLPLLPLLLFPWFLWPALWRALAGMPLDRGARLILSWITPAFVCLSAISGKQPHYLLPLFPGFALLAGAALDAARLRRWSALPPALAIAGLGVAALLGGAGHIGAALPATPAWAPGIALVAVAVVLLLFGRGSAVRVARALAVASMLAVGAVYAEAVRLVGFAHDLRAVAAHLAQLEAAGVPIAHVGEYHGQYHFLGRLRMPFAVIEADRIPMWLRENPRGRVIAYTNVRVPHRASAWLRCLVVERSEPYRGQRLLIGRAPADAPKCGAELTKY
ncbi:MAG TPA: glycosyltransferase family 39 protein [Burkholderiales bacterium]